jgi:hypothetical protein
MIHGIKAHREANYSVPVSDRSSPLLPDAAPGSMGHLKVAANAKGLVAPDGGPPLRGS